MMVKKITHKGDRKSFTFPIAAKLIILVTIILFLSLGLISFLVALFVSRDIENTAWENDRNINFMSSKTAELELKSVQNDVSVFLNSISVFNSVSSENVENLTNFFFETHKNIAAISIQSDIFNKNVSDLLLENTEFLIKNSIDTNMLNSFLAVNSRFFSGLVSDEAVILNAAPVLNSLPVLVMLYNWEGSFSSAQTAIFFSSESLTTSFGTGANSTIVINNNGDVLISSDQNLIAQGANISALPYIQRILRSSDSTYEERYKDDKGNVFFAASNKLSFGNVVVITTIAADVVFEGINSTTRRNIYLSFGVWFLTLLFLWFFAKTISKPLVSLSDAVNQIEDGDYQIELKSKGNDETRELTQSVLSMNNAFQNFERFTNKEIARLSRQGKLITGGTRKTATLFFSDIRSFTAISEKLTPDEIIGFLNEYMDKMVACVFKTGGTIDKFIGDAIMAHWGAVETAGTPAVDALNAVSAALMMRASLFSFNKNRDSIKKPHIKIGCGLNTGDVAAGQIGSKERVVFTVIGKSVMLAERMESFNKTFATDILISGGTYDFVKDYIIAEEMGEVKDKEDVIKIYAVINSKDDELTNKLLSYLDEITNNDNVAIRECLGTDGPQNITEIRALLGNTAPNVSNIDVNEEKKFKVAAERI